MSAEARPEAQPFDPGSGEIPPTLRPVITDPDTPILLLVAADADDDAARAAIGLADGRARQGLPTLLADGSFDPPRLSRLLDVSNLEGLADLFLFGASLGHVAMRPDGRRFDFIPAGAYVPDPQSVLRSPRWERVADEVTSAKSLLMLFVPASAPGLGDLSRRVRRALLIGETDQLRRVGDWLHPSCEVVGAITPRPGTRRAEPAAAATAGLFDEPELTEPPVLRVTRRKRRTSPVLVVALLATLAAGAWYAYQEYWPQLAQPMASAPVAEAAQPVAERGSPVETPLPFSVAVEAHQDAETARERLAQLRRAQSEVEFYLAPVAVREDLYYRLLAGPVGDREAGERLMRRLVEEGQKSDVDDWAVRPTEYAFHLGEYDSRPEAQARVEALVGLDIPAYVVPIRYETGTPRYRVYGGAYENQAEADVMKEMLENAGIDARLIPRTGEPAA